MRQNLLWNTECEEARTDLWCRLPEESRAELVAQLVRLVVEALVNAGNRAKSERRNHGFESPSATSRTTDTEVVDLVRRLAEDGLDDTQIARVLIRQGLRTATGLGFTQRRVQSVRQQYHIARGATECRAGEKLYTANEAARALEVSSQTLLHHWLRSGLLRGSQAAPWAPWRIVLDEETRQRLAGNDAPEGWVGLEEAAMRLGVCKQSVADWVNSGKLKAVRVARGRRKGWRICIDSTGLEKQLSLCLSDAATE